MYKRQAGGGDDLAGDGLQPVKTLLGHILGQDGHGLAGQQLGVEGAAAAVVAGGGPHGVVIGGIELTGHQAGSQAAEGGADLVAAGYGRVEQTMAPGEFAVRGGIVDIFPMGAEAPLRLDLFDDEIDAIRSFDPDSQRSTGNVDRVRILPGHEFAFDEESRNRFRAAWRAAFPGDPNKCPVYVDVGSGICSPGIEYYMPLFFESTGTLADYLPDNALFITLGETRDAIDAFMRQTQERYKFLSHDAQRPALAPEKLFDNCLLYTSPSPRD